MDFTIKKYKELLINLQRAGYSFQTFAEFYTNPEKKVIILRHDVDRLPENSLKFAEIQSNLNIAGSYYFRIVDKSFNKVIMKKISDLGHEIGYHYETMDTSKGDINRAYDEFCKNLGLFRKIVAVKTICMHGSPLSRYDNRNIWNKYDYRSLNIIAEPYFDIDFTEVFYITDTGRRYDGDKVNIRDKPLLKIESSWPSFHSTENIIESIKCNKFPNTVMINLHPQRWTDNIFLWTKELIGQSLKNNIKRVIVDIRQSKNNSK